MDLGWLEDFIAVVNARSFTLAAAERKCTQPTLTRRIRSLEDSIGAQLLNREVTPVATTPAGHSFYEQALEIVSQVTKLREELRTTYSNNTLRLYTLHTLAATYVPMLIRDIRRIAPEDEFAIRVSITMGRISECTEAVAYGAVPLMIAYESLDKKLEFQVPREKIPQVTVEHDALIPVCPAGEAKEYESRIEKKLPVKYLAYSEGTYLSNLVIDKINIQQLNVNQIDDAQMVDTLRNLARAKQGMAWVLRSTAHNALGKNEIDEIAIPELAIPLQINLFRSMDYKMNEEQQIALQRVWRAAMRLAEEKVVHSSERRKERPTKAKRRSGSQSRTKGA